MIGGRLIKVCGLRAADNVRAVAALPGVDLVGFIFHPASPRCVTDVPDVPLPDGVRRVGVFVDVPEEQIVATARRYGLHLVQLHGHESPDMCRRLTDRGLGVIKAFPATPEAVRNDTARYATSDCRLFLFDTPTAAHGGSGRTFDWHVLQDYVGQTPFLLGGGLGPDALDALSHPSPLGRLRPQQSLRTLPRRERRRGATHVLATLRRRIRTRPNFPGLGEALIFFCLLFFHQGKAPTGARKFFPVLFQG